MAAGGTFGEHLKRARKALGWSQQRLAQEAGLESKGYISALETGERPIPPGRTLESICRALGVPASELVGAIGPRKVKLVGYVGAGAAAHYYAGADDLGELVDAPDDANEQTVALEIRGESLGALFESWLVYFDDVRSPVTPDLYNRLCVVGLPDGRVLVKRIRKARTEGLFHLDSNTEPTMNDHEIVWAARVKTMRPR